MRHLILSVLVAGLATAALANEGPAAPPSAPTIETGVARPGGTYTSFGQADANACAAACAQDTLCMSWTFVADPQGRCDLKAVIPHPVMDHLAVSGLAARAPGFSRLVQPTSIGPPRDLAAAPEPVSAPAAWQPPPVTAPPPPQVPTQGRASEDPEAPIEAAEASTTLNRPLPPTDDAPILLSADRAPLALRTREPVVGP
jgi:hypothetical protein